MNIPNPIIVALDVPDSAQALQLVHALSGKVGAFKVGKELFVSSGPEIVKQIRATGAHVFLDLKFHDIPNTVAKAVEAATFLDVQMLTIHASGGKLMMQAAEEAAQKTALKLNRPAPLVLAVTVLTSLDGPQIAEIGLQPDVEKQVERLALLAASAGIRGLVCSPLEIVPLRKVIPPSVQLVTPGIRPAASDLGDQKRVMTPREAVQAGANWLVIGRPIYASPNPADAALQILQSLSTPHPVAA